jgi:hypothetical protein
MKLLLATALTTFAVCVAALGCGSDQQDTTAPAANVPADFFGVVPQGGITDADLERMGTGKVGTLRLVLPWDYLDPTAAPGDTDLSTIDPVVLGAARYGIRLLPTLYGTPDWVAHDIDGVDCKAGTDNPCSYYAPRSAEALAAWKSFVSDMVTRYGPDGEFWATHPDVSPVPIRAWQIWNEQNSPSFFQPAPDPDAYAKVLSSAADAIRDFDPGAQVLLGGMFQQPLHGKPPAYKADDFLQKLYAIDGTSDDFDGVAAHPYSPDVSAIEAQVQLLHEQIDAAGDDATLWITEVGGSSGDGSDCTTPCPLEVGPDGQADLLRQAFNFFLDKRTDWKIDSVIWYSWRDTSPDFPVCDWCVNSGLFPETGFDAKPAWGAFTSFTGGT